MEPLLLAEDKSELRAMLRKALERSGYTVEEAADGTSAIAKIRARRFLLILTDLKLPGSSGLDILRESKQADPSVPVILITAFGSIEDAVTAMKEGAFDFVQKPVDLDHLDLLVARAAREQELLRENLLLREEYAQRYGFPRIVGEHPSMKAATQQAQRVAATDSTVLLLGESGTGKELFARAVHHLSNRREHPFVALNCAAIPEGLVENELFGHERGAYTGAGTRKAGKDGIGPSRHSLPGRNRRAAHQHPVQVAARAGREALRARRRHAGHRRGRAHRGGHQQESARGRQPERHFAKTFTSASPPCPSPFRHCAIAAMTCSCWPKPFSIASAANSASPDWR